MAMKPDTNRTSKLMEAATRMMLAGEVERYMRTLRLLLALRNRTASWA